MKKFLQVFGLCALLSLPTVGWAQNLLLDAESTDYLTRLARPLLQAAAIPEDSTQIFIIDNPQINAFVTPDRHIFFHTGLIEKASNGNEIQGVMAHEIGHIKGRHFIKARAAQDAARWPAIVGAVLGAGAMAAGAGQVGQALVLGSSAASLSSGLKFSRAQEQQADAIAIDLLRKTGASPQGLASFFNKLQTEGTLFARTPPAYLLTHPVPSARLDFIKQNLSLPAAQAVHDHMQADFERFKTKVLALSETPGQTLRRHMNDASPNGVYARAIAHALQGQKDESLKLIQKLRAQSSEDVFYQELEAQVLLDHGEVKEASQIFATLVAKRPDLWLIALQYADALVANNQAAEALAYYQRVAQLHPDWAGIHHRLGVAYGKAGELTASHVSLAQESIINQNLDEAQMHLNTAELYREKASVAARQRLDLLKEALAEAKEE